MEEWEIVFWDVGQGDATTIKFPDGSYALIDCGPGLQQGNPLPAWFRRMGNPKIKFVVVTHSHVDHFGGLTALCSEDAQPIESIYMLNDGGLRSNPRTDDLEILLRSLKSRKDSGKSSLHLVEKAQDLYSDSELRLRIIYPKDISDGVKVPSDVNKTSMVILLESVRNPDSNPMIVFGSDAPLKALESTCKGLNPVILTGPHHGSPHAITPEYRNFFRKDMCPQNIFISVGRRNGYRHPNVKYVKGAACAGICVACSQLSVNCDEDRTADVFEGSALSGVDKPAHSVQCRGAMRVYASSNGLRFDENQAEFVKTIAEQYSEAPCKCHSVV